MATVVSDEIFLKQWGALRSTVQVMLDRVEGGLVSFEETLCTIKKLIRDGYEEVMYRDLIKFCTLVWSSKKIPFLLVDESEEHLNWVIGVVADGMSTINSVCGVFIPLDISYVEKQLETTLFIQLSHKFYMVVVHPRLDALMKVISTRLETRPVPDAALIKFLKNLHCCTQGRIITQYGEIFSKCIPDMRQSNTYSMTPATTGPQYLMLHSSETNEDEAVRMELEHQKEANQLESDERQAREMRELTLAVRHKMGREIFDLELIEFRKREYDAKLLMEEYKGRVENLEKQIALVKERNIVFRKKEKSKFCKLREAVEKIHEKFCSQRSSFNHELQKRNISLEKKVKEVRLLRKREKLLKKELKINRQEKDLWKSQYSMEDSCDSCEENQNISDIMRDLGEELPEISSWCKSKGCCKRLAAAQHNNDFLEKRNKLKEKVKKIQKELKIINDEMKAERERESVQVKRREDSSPPRLTPAYKITNDKKDPIPEKRVPKIVLRKVKDAIVVPEKQKVTLISNISSKRQNVSFTESETINYFQQKRTKKNYESTEVTLSM